MGGTQNVSFLGRRYFKLPILSCPRIPPATQAKVNYASFWEPELDGFFQESKETTFGTLNRISSSSVLVSC